jgi:hypothetical protein
MKPMVVSVDNDGRVLDSVAKLMESVAYTSQSFVPTCLSSSYRRTAAPPWGIVNKSQNRIATRTGGER